jgi:hypothetical protein
MTDLTSARMVEINEFGEAEAQADFLLCSPPEFARLTRLEVKRIGSVWVSMIPELDSAFFNRIVGLGIGESATESMLEEAIAVLENAGCQNYMAQLSPLAEPAQCQEWLERRGLAPSRNWAKMYRGNEPAPMLSSDLRVEKIGKGQADAFAEVVLKTFEMPPILRLLVKGFVGQPGWLHYLAFDGQKPVAGAAMFVKGEVGWLGFAGTLKQYRKRGGQGALFSRRIQDGLALGCKWFVTETGEDTPEDPNPSYHNMQRSGFKLAYLRRNYVHKATLQPVKIVQRVLFVAATTMRFEWQRFRNH